MSKPTFKLIYHSTAVQLYEAKHPIYIIWDGENTIKPCYVPPDKVLVPNPIFYITTELHNKLMNKRTPQQALVESRPAQEAWLAGKPLQYKHIIHTDYKDYNPASSTDAPCFMDPSFFWRPKPEPEKVPFNQQTIPADAWFRAHNSETAYKPQYIGAVSVGFSNGHVLYQQLADNFDYSADRINWFPCYTLKNT